MPEDVKALEMRIAELEKKLAAASVRTSVSQLTTDEIAAFHKVRDVIAADWGDFCGINDCFRCVIPRCVVTPRCIVRCINECVCGPCSMGGRIGMGGLAQFDQFGG